MEEGETLPPPHKCLVLLSSQRTMFWDVRRPRKRLDLVHGLQVRAQPSVHCEDLLLDDGGDGHAVEAVRESPPELDVMAALAYK